ncbi:MAG: TonB family protein [candidate division Zixibacteria bacterium]|nr:TonB family protein [candidate division Zixibacteria bacterium]
MRLIGGAFVIALCAAAGARAADLPRAYAEAIAARDFGRLLAELNRQFDVPPIPVSEPETVYPEVAGRAGAQGTVKVVLYVDERGDVGEVVIADSPGWFALEEAARRAAYTIRYRPATRKGEPVAAWYVADIIFYIAPPDR